MRKVLLKSISIVLILMMCGCSGIKDGIDHVKAYGDIDTRLADAISSTNLEGVKEALANGADINASYVKYPVPHKVNPYLYSFEHYNRQVTLFLLENGANLDIRTDSSDGVTPLASAAIQNNVDECKVLLSYGADIEYTTRGDYTPLDCAAFVGSEDVVAFLLENGAVVTNKTLDRALEGEYGNGYLNYGTVRLIVYALVSQGKKIKMDEIELAAVAGDSAKVISLGNKGKLNSKNLFLVGNNVAAFCSSEALEFCIQNGFTLTRNEEYYEYELPLDVAARYGNIETVRWMLDHWDEYGEEADPEYTAINQAVINRQYELVSYMISLGTDLRLDNNEGGILDNAVHNKDAKMVALLLESKPIISESRLINALDTSILNNDYDSAKLLLQVRELSEASKEAMWTYAYKSLDILKLCAEYDKLPTDGDLLIYSAGEGSYDVVEFLVENGAEVNCYTYDDLIGVPIEAAVKHGFFDIVKLLVENGADVNYGNEVYGSMLMLASKTSANITQYLIDNGAEIDWQSESSGNTALTGAVEREHIECVKVLLNAGADVSIKNNEGLTAVDLAKKSGNKELMSLFE